MKSIYLYNNVQLETLELDNKKDKTIFIIHGFTADFDNLKVITEHFKDQFNIYSINLPAHGKSQTSEELNDIYAYCDVVVDFIKNKQLKNIYLIGHSMGGLIATMIYEKIKEIIDKVLLIAPANLTTLEIGEKLKYAFFKGSLLSKITFVRYSYHRWFKALRDKQFRASSAKWYEEHKQYMDDYFKVGHQFMEEKILKDQEEMIKKIDKPIGLLCGKSDNIVNQKKIWEYFKRIKPETKMYKINACGHNPWRENKTDVLQAVERFFNE
ncbi:alpha/beta hydrolase [Mycoplasmopsis anatis]|uniref:alpha/beta fold hydrolase n=1 Tax=Mycoplasmopsis anatis TaxID=171279 RepID=UPI001C4E2B17|nr:alpha/beta hydrolase [Mycoplasmopsis anatis]MBW0594742.1 alpha/beta hydrolase [Mycoplasmopsis anatis]MBW0595208.1 alpha/beta hydrolase [Mycoplasmopsis anatis]MBW0595885.1 alpha/beta hydrolase [Mycoplasmopsis anatis]MBW0598309.1 alpha/beta hydrolase [Mycoplasmopsis anatis]MBW0599066.1 alpha/beta hydrolase [Mycoplasmopsis anatis]